MFNDLLRSETEFEYFCRNSSHDGIGRYDMFSMPLMLLVEDHLNVIISLPVQALDDLEATTFFTAPAKSIKYI